VGALVVFGPIAVASDFSGDIDVSEGWFKKTDEAIRMLTDLIKSMPDSDAKATRMVQLAELHWQKSSKLHLVAMSKHNRLYDEWVAADGARRGLPEPQIFSHPDERASAGEMERAIELYKHVISKYPNNSRAHVAHYYLGQTYFGLARDDDAKSVFQRLIEKYPNSEYVPDAYRALYEHYKSHGDLENAQRYYELLGPQWKPLDSPAPRTTGTSQ
jgi:TolA-binding protein